MSKKTREEMKSELEKVFNIISERSEEGQRSLQTQGYAELSKNIDDMTKIADAYAALEAIDESVETRKQTEKNVNTVATQLNYIGLSVGR